MSDLIRIDIACADEAEAQRIAETLIAEGLAACCQTVPMSSLYRWCDRIERSAEIRLSIKALAGQFLAIEKKVKRLHSYDVPQIVAIPITHVSEDYANWVRANSSA